MNEHEKKLSDAWAEIYKLRGENETLKKQIQDSEENEADLDKFLDSIRVLAENKKLRKRVAELVNGIKNHGLIIESCFVKNCNNLVVCKKQSHCCNDPLCGCGDPPICDNCYATI